MAQDFRNQLKKDMVTAHHNTNSVLWTGGNYDALISIRLANTSASQITVSVYIANNSVNYYLIKDAPISSGGSLELIDAGSKIVIKSGDVLHGIASVASSADAVVSAVDTISA